MKPQYIVLHHSAVANGGKNQRQVKGIERTHKERFNFKSSLGSYVGYHYLIDGDATLTQHRKDTEAGAHCLEQNMNYKSIGICLAGNFDIELPTAAQRVALKKKLTELMAKYAIHSDKVVFHRDYATYKSCPGKKFTRALLNEILAVKPTAPILKEKGKPMIYANVGGVLVPFTIDWDTYVKDFKGIEIVEVDSLAGLVVSKLKIV